jgi:hypothetical protein
MKIKNAFFAAILAVAALTMVGLGLNASAQNGTPSSKSGRDAAIILKCRNYGGQQDVAKNPDIINSTLKILPKGKTLYWKSTDGDSGSVVLSKALGPGDKVGVNGKPGQSYTCTAWTTK